MVTIQITGHIRNRHRKHEMTRIGSVELANKVVLAPLAGITDLPFRRLVKAHGCGLVYSEMISSNGLVYNSGKTRQMLASDPEEKPLAVQIFGANPDIMARAAVDVEASGADMIDINFGCSVRKVVKTGAGAALMKTPELAEDVIRAVREAVSIPLTIKIRSGWDRSGKEAFTLLEIAEKNGVDAIAVHPRTAGQGFGGQADWRLIAEIKQQSSLPIIGNGDIKSAEDARRMLEETGCDAVMIGRAAIGNPWIFSETVALLAGCDPPTCSVPDRCDAMHRYLAEAVHRYGEHQACRMMRSRLGWFVKGLPSSSHFRESIKHLATQQEAQILITAYREFLENYSEKRNATATGPAFPSCWKG